jgi:hypothetical protein
MHATCRAGAVVEVKWRSTAGAQELARRQSLLHTRACFGSRRLRMAVLRPIKSDALPSTRTREPAAKSALLHEPPGPAPFAGTALAAGGPVMSPRPSHD